MEDYAHFMYAIQRADGTYLRVDRVLKDGKRMFFTEIKVEMVPGVDVWEHFNEVASQFGKFLLLDSPVARTALGLDEDHPV